MSLRTVRRRTVLHVLAAVGVLAATVALPATATVAAPTVLTAAGGPAGPVFGAQFHGMWTDYTDPQRAQVLDALAASGAQWVRLDVSWAMLQPASRDAYSPSGVAFVDRVIKMITARGLKPLVMFWMTPAWANAGAGERVLPTNYQDYASAAGWAARRWAGQVPAWEVWNEPNLEDFMVGTDPVAYGQLLQTAYPAIKAGAPTAKVVFGGTVYNDVEWIRSAYAAGAKGSFDVLATHPYQAIANLPPEQYDGTKWTLRHARAVRDLMVANGDGDKAMWFTEFGWSSHDNAPNQPNWSRGVTQEQQADYLVRTLRLVASEMPFVTNVFWYNERNRTDDGLQNNNYGLMNHDGTPKPALLAARHYLLGGSVPAPTATSAPTATPTQATVVACPYTPPASAVVALCAPVTYQR